MLEKLWRVSFKFSRGSALTQYRGIKDIEIDIRRIYPTKIPFSAANSQFYGLELLSHNLIIQQLGVSIWETNQYLYIAFIHFYYKINLILFRISWRNIASGYQVLY